MRIKGSNSTGTALRWHPVLASYIEETFCHLLFISSLFETAVWNMKTTWKILRNFERYEGMNVILYKSLIRKLVKKTIYLIYAQVSKNVGKKIWKKNQIFIYFEHYFVGCLCKTLISSQCCTSLRDVNREHDHLRCTSISQFHNRYLHNINWHRDPIQARCRYILWVKLQFK